MSPGTASAAEQRIAALAARLSHDDPDQLFFQVAEIAGEQIYLRHGVEVGPGDVVLDVGANVGVAAVFFADQCSAARVWSFEPAPPSFAMLERNVAGLEACVPVPLGLGAEAGETTMAYYPGAAAMSGLYVDPERDRALVRIALLNAGFSPPEAERRLGGLDEVRQLRVRLTTVSDFVREHAIERVDLLKIDVERAEPDVLAGVGEVDWPRIRQAVIEVHDEDGRAAQIADALERRGFTVALDQDDAMRGTGVRMAYATRRTEPRRGGERGVR